MNVSVYSIITPGAISKSRGKGVVGGEYGL